MIPALLLVWLLVVPAWATPLRLDGFDAVTADATTAKDVFGWAETTTDTSVYPQATTTHNANNGGTDSSAWSLFVDVASGASGYYSLDTASAKNTLALGVSVHLPTQTLSTTRQILTIRETARDGCAVRLNADRTLTLLYNGVAISGATTGEAIEARVCCTDNTTDPTECDPRIECANDAACGSGKQCGIGNAAADAGTCAADGGGCYWGGIELIELYTSATQVECQLWIDGRQSLAPGVQSTTGATQPQDVRLGATGTEAQALDLYLDDVVLNDESRAGFGYVLAAVPNADGSTNAWNKNSCGGAAAPHNDCLDDWISGGSYEDGSNLSISTTNRTEEFLDTSPTWTIESGESIEAVEYLLVGTTNAAGATQDTFILVGTQAGTPAVGITAPDLSSAGLYGRGMWTTAPNASGGTGAWTVTNASQLGLRITTTNGTTRQLSAVMVYANVQKPDEPLPITLADHNQGTDDGLVAVYTVGDSTNGGTLSSTCPSGADVGELCSQQDYCSWEPDTKDKPVGGCNGDNDACITCTGRRTETANGAGYACLADSDCACTGGDCTNDCVAGICAANTQTSVPCSTGTDCDLGTCETTATCVDSCAGADCPTRTAWGTFLAGRIGADLIARCYFGGETSADLVTNRIRNILAGEEVTCEAVAGSGACGCTTNEDCGACSTSATTACDADGDCSAGGTCTTGTCTNGVCTAGPAIRTSCAAPSTDCASGEACVMAPPDYVLVLEGYNDSAFVQGTPNCDGPLAVIAGGQDQGFPFYGGECDLCADTYCAADSDCSGLSADAQCFGFKTSAGGEQMGCLGGGGAGCTRFTQPCRDNDDCPDGLTCTGGDATHWLAQGTCTCTTTANCETATGNTLFTCSDSLCTLECASDATCGGMAGSCTGGLCKGRCTCPSNARSCTRDADCVGVTKTLQGFTRTYRGTCVGGQCSCMGPNRCRVDDECPDSYRHFYAGAKHAGVVDQLHAINAIIGQLPETDGRPLLIPNTLPRPDSPTECVEPSTGAPGQNVYGDWQYFDRNRLHILEEFPVTVDAYLALFGQTDVHTDIVHFNATGGDLIARANVQLLQSLGTCATTDSDGQLTPQKYCRNATGTWEATTCNASADCNADESCQVAHCSAKCRTNQDCVNWFGTGHTCTNGFCDLSGADSCASAFGVGYAHAATGECTNGASDACAGAATCNLEP